MQLTARQREFAGIAGWAVPVSVTLGAVFGHFQTPNGGVWGYIKGAVAAILISTTVLLLEFAVFSRTRSALARRVPFLLYLALRSLGYLAAILMGLAVSAWLVRESAESEPLIERGGLIFSLVLSLGFKLLYGASSPALTSFRRFPRAREGRGGSGPSFGSSRRRFLFAKFFLTGSVGRAAPARRRWPRRPS